MFENLREAFREAVRNFREELNRDEVPDAVDRLLHRMQEEVTDAQSQLHVLDDQIRRALQAARREQEEVVTCRRREAMARRIGDEETARIAREFAEKHERRRQVQERKARALGDELEMRRAEVEEMLDRIREARGRRNSLAATAGRATARDSLREAEDLFVELDRMAERIAGDEERRKAREELEEEEALAREIEDPEALAEARLRELKRRMDEG